MYLYIIMFIKLYNLARAILGIAGFVCFCWCFISHNAFSSILLGVVLVHTITISDLKLETSK